jgi:hypothetical protein
MGLSKEVVEPMLANMEDIEQNTIKKGTNSRRFWNEAVSWNFKNRLEDEGDILFRDNKVVMIHFGMEKNIPLSTLIKHFGEPKEVFITKGILDGIQVVVNIIYPEQGICLEEFPRYLIWEPEKVQLHASTPIEKIFYVDPSGTKGQILLGCLEGLNSAQQKKYVQTWQGYGEYNAYQVINSP